VKRFVQILCKRRYSLHLLLTVTAAMYSLKHELYFFAGIAFVCAVIGELYGDQA
jgi:hypothetical protein